MAIMRKLIGRKQEMFSASSPPRYTRLSDEDCKAHVRKGFVPVMVGDDERVKERFLIPTRFISHPNIVALLDSSAHEFGYNQEGVIQIPTHPDCFREIVRRLH